MNYIKIKNQGYIDCNSKFYSVLDILEETVEYDFKPGVNKLFGEIDSGIFGISFLISMYKYIDKQMLYAPQIACVDDKIITLKELSNYACYMDITFPLFSTNRSISQLVEVGLKKNKISKTKEDIRDLFQLDGDRFNLPVKKNGNEMFRAMAAIGFCFEKQIFCFPWLSKKRFDSYGKNITWLLDNLALQNKIVILPIGL